MDCVEVKRRNLNLVVKLRNLVIMTEILLPGGLAEFKEETSYAGYFVENEVTIKLQFIIRYY